MGQPVILVQDHHQLTPRQGKGTVPIARGAVWFFMMFIPYGKPAAVLFRQKSRMSIRGIIRDDDLKVSELLTADRLQALAQQRRCIVCGYANAEKGGGLPFVQTTVLYAR